MTPLAQAVTGALVQFVWQGFLAAFLVSVAMFVLRRHNPRLRYAVYCITMFVLALLPFVTAAVLYDPFASANPEPARITLTIRGVWTGGVPSSGVLDRWLGAAEPWILEAWLLGVLFLSLRLVWMGSRISALRRSGEQPASPILVLADTLARRMGLRRAVCVLVSSLPDGPGVVGWIRPVILLPAATVLNLTPGQLEAILAHELAHLRRYDDVVNIAQSVVETLFFYHPAVWWISNRIRHERELCCDDLAVSASGNAFCYARALTALERMRIRQSGAVMAALGNSGSSLEHRIHRIVDARYQSSRPSALPGVVALALAVGCIVLYSNPARGSAPAPPPPPPIAEYPEAARLRGIQGTVPVQVQIDDSGEVSHARAIGGPKELRQAAVARVSSLHLPELAATSERVDVAFALVNPAPQLVASVQPPPPVAISRASIFRSLLATLELASGKTEPIALDAGRRAGKLLLERYGDYLDRDSELLIHNTLAYIAQSTGDDAAAEAEFRKILSIDPDQAHASFLLGGTIIRERSQGNELRRYSEAIYVFIRSLKVTGPGALSPEMKAAAETALRECYESYHGSIEGLEELMSQVGDSPLPPGEFHVLSMSEMSVPLPQPYAVLPAPLDDGPKPVKHHNVVARVFRGIFRALRHLA